MTGSNASDRAEARLAIGLYEWATYPDGRPIVAESSRGAYFWDVEGCQYTDWMMGRGAALLGYRRPEVETAIRDTLESGLLFSVPHRLEVEVAEQLVTRHRFAERVAFGKNGSDVCAAAIRLARAHTGRQGILHYGYHGFHDWIAATNRDIAGIPESMRSWIYGIEYNDLDALAVVLDGHAEEIAVLIMEPRRDAAPRDGFLEGVRALTQQHGIVLVFDEIVTGFRLDPPSVEPDLACFSKAMTNGMPLSALVGREPFMAKISEIGFGVTTRGEVLSLAAARAALEIHASVDVPAAVAEIGERLRSRFGDVAARVGVDASLEGHPAMMSFSVPDGLRAQFLATCREHGVLTHGYALPSLAHDDEAIERSVPAFEAALRAIS